MQGIEEYHYEPNGLTVLLMEDHAAPVVNVQVVYRVGSINEVTGNTGATHILEHLNFKGTPTFNKDKGTAITSQLQGVGAQMNASTWNDRTNYYETVPSEHMELAIHIEADRMRNSLLLDEDRQAEMTVVRNEFEQAESNPERLMEKELWAHAFIAHPYHHQTIGWRSDVEKIPIEAIKRFYDTYYWPENATLTLLGDFNKEEAFALIDKYFGKIGRAPKPMVHPYTEEPEQLGPRQFTVYKPIQQSMVTVAFKAPGYQHEDYQALAVLADLIGSGWASTLAKEFIDEGKAVNARAKLYTLKEHNLLSLQLSLPPDGNHEAIAQELAEVIENKIKTGYSAEDVNRVITKMIAQQIMSRDGVFSVARELTESIARGDWTLYFRQQELLSQVTAEDVKRVAEKYLNYRQSTTGYLKPDMPSAPGTAPGGGAVNLQQEPQPNYWREPGTLGVAMEPISEEAMTGPAPQKSTELDYSRTEVAGIDLVTVPTGAKGFIELKGHFSVAGFLDQGFARLLPDITADMLSTGTETMSKQAISTALDELGASVRISGDTYGVTITLRCLKSDVPEAITILADQLINPAFDESEFKLLIDRNIAQKKSLRTNTQALGTIALTQETYPENHPSYRASLDEEIAMLEKLTIEDVKAFYKAFFGTESMHMVVVGDIEQKVLTKALKHSFSSFSGGQDNKHDYPSTLEANADVKVIHVPQKPNAQLIFALPTGLSKDHEDYHAFYMANDILGGDFSARLMMSVRDNQGLTYGIGSYHIFDTYGEGVWMVAGQFSPTLIEKGVEATMEEIVNWSKNGVTAEELAIRKNAITGNFKVTRLATARAMAYTILDFVVQGLDPDYVDEYPKIIQALTLEEVNASVEKYFDIDKLLIIKTGTLPAPTN